MHHNSPSRYSGLIFAVLVLIGNGLQPIITNARPQNLDDLLFTFTTVFLELFLTIPFFLLERYRSKFQKKKIQTNSLETNQKKEIYFKQLWWRLGLIGLIFAISTYIVILGYSSVDNITGSIGVKTQPISMLFIGLIFLKERISIWEILCTCLMLFAIYFVATAGTFQIEQLSIGFLYLLIAPILWNIGHSLAKPLLTNKIITTLQLIVARTGISSIFLGIIYFARTKGSDFWQFFEGPYFLFMFLMGFNYFILHYFWYLTITKLKLTVATSIIIPAPLITTIFAYFILNQTIFYYHYIGMGLAFLGLYGQLLINQKNSTNSSKK